MYKSGYVEMLLRKMLIVMDPEQFGVVGKMDAVRHILFLVDRYLVTNSSETENYGKVLETRMALHSMYSEGDV
jgi:hypothetical protein